MEGRAKGGTSGDGDVPRRRSDHQFKRLCLFLACEAAYVVYHPVDP